MEKETRAQGSVGMADNGDMTGNEPLQGTRHLAAESGAGLVDQDENLKETVKNGGRSVQADYGTRNDPRIENKERSAAPETGAPVTMSATPQRTAAKRTSKRK